MLEVVYLDKAGTPRIQIAQGASLNYMTGYTLLKKSDGIIERLSNTVIISIIRIKHDTSIDG